MFIWVAFVAFIFWILTITRRILEIHDCMSLIMFITHLRMAFPSNQENGKRIKLVWFGLSLVFQKKSGLSAILGKTSNMAKIVFKFFGKFYHQIFLKMFFCMYIILDLYFAKIACLGKCQCWNYETKRSWLISLLDFPSLISCLFFNDFLVDNVIPGSSKVERTIKKLLLLMVIVYSASKIEP